MTFKEYMKFYEDILASSEDGKYPGWTVSVVGPTTFSITMDDVCIGFSFNGITLFLNTGTDISDSEVAISFIKISKPTSGVHTLDKVDTIDELTQIFNNIIKCDCYRDVVVYEHNYKSEKALNVLD